jgi:hypothetical protein
MKWTGISAIAMLLAFAAMASADDLTDAQKQAIDSSITQRGLNQYGDAQGTMYMGGTPLFNEATGTRTDRYDYIKQQHPELLGPPVPASSTTGAGKTLGPNVSPTVGGMPKTVKP